MMRLSAVLSVLVLAASPAVAQEWRLETPVASPIDRASHSVVCDAARDRLVMFGGYNWNLDVHYDETWEYDGATWAQRHPLSAPAPRKRAGMCYDSRRGVVALFGGLRDSFWGPTTWFGDTWEYDGTNWTQVPVSGPVPSARYCDLTFDSARGVAVLVGGTGPTGRQSDTWEFDGTTWTQRHTPTTLPLRPSWATAFDARRGVVVAHPEYVYGNLGPWETWEYDGTDWSLATFTLSPGACPSPAMTFDAQRGKVVLVGGAFAGVPDTWEYDGVDWQRSGVNQLTDGLTGQALAFDAGTGSVVLFGGEKIQGIFVVGTNETFRYGTFAGFDVIGTSCGPNRPAPLPALAAPNETPQLGGTFDAVVDDLMSADLPVLVLGFATANNGLANLGLPGCTQHVRVDATHFLASQGNSASWQLTVPAQPVLQGVQLFAQVLVLDGNAQPAAVTNGARLTIGL